VNLFRFRLKELREEKNISRSDLAEILGVSVQTIANYENGHREPNFDTLLKIADFFNVTVDYLIGNSNFRTREEEFRGKNFYEKYKLDDVIDDSMDAESKAIIGNILVNNVEPLIKNISGVLYQHLFGESRKQVLGLFKKLLEKLNAYFYYILEFSKNDMYFLALKSYAPTELFKFLFEKRNIVTVVFDKEKHEPLYIFKKELADEDFKEMFRDVLKFYSSALADLLLHQKEIYSVFDEIENYYSENLKTNITQMIEEDNSSKEVEKEPIKEGDSNGSKDT